MHLWTKGAEWKCWAACSRSWGLWDVAFQDWPWHWAGALGGQSDFPQVPFSYLSRHPVTRAVSGNDTHLVRVSWEPSSKKPAQMSGCDNPHSEIRMLRDTAKHHTQGYMASEWQHPSKSRFPWNQKEHPSAKVQRKSMIGSGLLAPEGGWNLNQGPHFFWLNSDGTLSVCWK